jgi:hypothetical protein
VPLGLWLFPLILCILRTDRIPCWKFRLSHSVHGDLPGANGFLVPDPNSRGGVEGVQHWSTHNHPMDGDNFLLGTPLLSDCSGSRDPTRSSLRAIDSYPWNSVNRALKIAVSNSIFEHFRPFASTHPVNYNGMDLESCRRATGNAFSLFASDAFLLGLALDRVRSCWSLRSCME